MRRPIQKKFAKMFSAFWKRCKRSALWTTDRECRRKCDSKTAGADCGDHAPLPAALRVLFESIGDDRGTAGAGDAGLGARVPGSGPAGNSSSSLDRRRACGARGFKRTD